MRQDYVRYVLGIKLHEPRKIKDPQGRYYRAMTARLWTQGARRQKVKPIIDIEYFLFLSQPMFS